MNKFLVTHRDILATIFGIVAGVSGVLMANQVIDSTIGGSINGIAIVLLGAITNHGIPRKI